MNQRDLIRLRRCALVALACAVCGCATPSAPRQGRPVLASIHFEGNHALSNSELLSHIATSPTSGFFSKTARYYDADLFDIDRKRIVRWYNERGFYDARVTAVDELPDPQGRINLVVHIEEGRRTHVGLVAVSGLRDLAPDEQKDVQGRVSLKQGHDFEEAAYEKAKTSLVLALREHGFARAQVLGEAMVDEPTSTVRVNLQASPGIRYNLGPAVVTGNSSVTAGQILEAADLTPGDLYQPSRLDAAQQHVYNLGAFSAVRVTLDPPGPSPLAIPRIAVHEAPLQTVRVGLGLKVEQTRWQVPILRGEYSNRNLLGGLRRLELASTVGLAFTPSIFTRGDKGITTQNSAQIVFPNVLLPSLDSILRTEYAREFQQGFRYDQVAARAALLYRRGRHTLSPSLNFVRYFNVNRQLQLEAVLTKGGRALGILTTGCATGCTLTYPEIRYAYDARDSSIEPRDGFYAALDLQQALRVGSNSFRYFRIEPEARIYRPLGPHFTLAGRIQYGALIPEGQTDSPFTQRFFGGGQNGQRGYAPLRQGPKLGANPDLQGFAQDSVPTGGEGEMLLSTEVRIDTNSLLRNTLVVPFLDASRVTEKWQKPTLSGLEYGLGLGVRYLTPFGPIRFDIAYLLNPKDVIAASSEEVDANGQKTGNVLIRDTLVSAHCDDTYSSDPPLGVPVTRCIRESRFAFHITLGEAF